MLSNVETSLTLSLRPSTSLRVTPRYAMNYFVYILGNKSGTLYIGVTSDLERRLFEHKEGIRSDFAHRYRLTLLLYCETFSDPSEAIAREKRLKGWKRSKSKNPRWEDMADAMQLRKGLP
jgi:putative endonuclease